MEDQTAINHNERATMGNFISWVSGIVFLAIGTINTFWGNDPGYGIFIILLSLVFFPPATILLKKLTRINIPVVFKIMLAIFIVWSAVGVGELFHKIDMMRISF